MSEKHTYLDEGTWIAEGSYFDENGSRVICRGVSTIKHGSSWSLNGEMELFPDRSEPVRFTGTYDIVPPGSNAQMTTWKSINPALGSFTGHFAFIEDSIISVGATDDGKYSSYEFLTMVDERTYINRGFALSGDVKLSSWAVRLTK